MQVSVCVGDYAVIMLDTLYILVGWGHCLPPHVVYPPRTSRPPAVSNRSIIYGVLELMPSAVPVFGLYDVIQSTVPPVRATSGQAIRIVGITTTRCS